MPARKRLVDNTFSAVHKRHLGEKVKRLRERRLMSGPDMAKLLEISASSYSRCERGQDAFKLPELRRIIRHLDGLEPIPEEQKKELLALQKAADQRGRYGKYFAYVQPVTKRYAELEWGASRITELGDMFISGLLQSPDYIAAVMGKRTEDDLNERFTRFREARQEVLTRPDPPEMLFIQSEAALRQLVGGPEAMRKQLEHLLKLMELPNLTLRVLPFSAGLPCKNLTMLEFDTGAAPMLVSSAFGTVNTIENFTQVNLARSEFKLAAERAASAEESSVIISRIIDSM